MECTVFAAIYYCKKIRPNIVIGKQHKLSIKNHLLWKWHYITWEFSRADPLELYWRHVHVEREWSRSVHVLYQEKNARDLTHFFPSNWLTECSVLLCVCVCVYDFTLPNSPSILFITKSGIWEICWVKSLIKCQFLTGIIPNSSLLWNMFLPFHDKN